MEHSQAALHHAAAGYLASSTDSVLLMTAQSGCWQTQNGCNNYWIQTKDETVLPILLTVEHIQSLETARRAARNGS
jgi:hypothetical protein